jgi:hypothetical protein
VRKRMKREGSVGNNNERICEEGRGGEVRKRNENERGRNRGKVGKTGKEYE